MLEQIEIFDLEPGVVQGVINEYQRAITKHKKPFNSPHEGFAILEEERDELWDEVKAQHHNISAMRDECIQIAAVAIRFIVDVCDNNEDEVADKIEEIEQQKTIQSTINDLCLLAENSDDDSIKEKVYKLAERLESVAAHSA
jgi:hypothetical protein